MEAILKAKDSGRIACPLNLLQTISNSKYRTILSSSGLTKFYDNADTECINEIYKYTFNNFQKQVTIKNIAAAVNISPNSFYGYFKIECRMHTGSF